MIYLDAGHDLSESLPGPWLAADDRHALPGRAAARRTTFYPTIRHRPLLALRPTKYTLPSDEQNNHGDFPQGATLLQRNYGGSLDAQLMNLDPFYALHDLFSFSASSELQFLNLIESKVQPETGYAILSLEKPSLSNLLYSQEILQAHMQRLRENIETIKLRGGPNWPRV